MRKRIWTGLNDLRIFMVKRRVKAKYINAVSALCAMAVKEQDNDF